LLKVTESKRLSIKPVVPKGTPALVDGSAAWAVSDENLAELAVSEDGLSCLVTPKGPMGSFQLQVKADADMSEGVKEIFGEMQIDLVAGEAVAIEIAAVEDAPAPASKKK